MKNSHERILFWLGFQAIDYGCGLAQPTQCIVKRTFWNPLSLSRELVNFWEKCNIIKFGRQPVLLSLFSHMPWTCVYLHDVVIGLWCNPIWSVFNFLKKSNFWLDLSFEVIAVFPNITSLNMFWVGLKSDLTKSDSHHRGLKIFNSWTLFSGWKETLIRICVGQKELFPAYTFESGSS